MISVQEQLSDSIKALSMQTPVIVSGRVNRYDGQMAECDGFPATIGSLCEIETETNLPAIAEIIGFHGGHNLLSLHDYGARISVGAKVKVVDDGYTIAVGDGLLGRVTDALGSPLDEKPIANLNDQWPLLGKELNPLSKNPVNEPLDVGVRSINSLLSVGRGQRLGIIAGSGVGKSVLLGMMCKYTEADIVVVGMIGERGREVGSFVNNILSGESKKRTAIVAVPADRSPLLRIRGAERATAIAEYFRDKGKNVLLIMDSLTRVAHARREVLVAAGAELSMKQEDVVFKGHAIECRINAEHPRSFMPTPGKIGDYHAPGGLGVRVDSALYSGYRVPPHYDSMVAKLIVHGANRNECLLRLRRALGEFVIGGIETTIALHSGLIADDSFINGDYDIHWLEKHYLPSL